MRSTPTTVELFHKGQRVASHLRARGHGHTVTVAEHRPRSHQAHLEWTPPGWCTGPRPSALTLRAFFERIMNDKLHPEMGYRSCLGNHSPGRAVPPVRMEGRRRYGRL